MLHVRESVSSSSISQYDHDSRSAHARGLCDSHGTRLPAKENFLWRKCPPLQILKVPRRGACKCQVPCVRDASIPHPKYAQGAHATNVKYRASVTLPNRTRRRSTPKARMRHGSHPRPLIDVLRRASESSYRFLRVRKPGMTALCITYQAVPVPCESRDGTTHSRPG